MININRCNDHFFRALFGKAGNEDILESIINATLIDKGFEPLKNLRILNPYNLKDSNDSKETILDVKAITEDNQVVLIEMQLVGSAYFLDRVIYYIAKNIATNLKEGEDYSKVDKVISINFIDFHLDFNKGRKAHRVLKLVDIEDNEIQLDNIQIHLVDLKEFRKILETATDDDLKKSILLTWNSFMTCPDITTEYARLMEVAEIMARVLTEYDRYTADPQEIHKYISRETFLYGQRGMLKLEREQGRAEGLAEGEAKSKRDIAIKLLKAGNSVEFVSEVTGLSIEEVKKLQEEIKN